MPAVWPKLFSKTLLFLCLLLFVSGCQYEPVQVVATAIPPAPSRRTVSSGLALVEQWRFQTGRPNTSPSTFPPRLFATNDRVVVGHFVDDGKEQPDSFLTALSLQEGQVLWQTQYPSLGYGTRISTAHLDEQANRLFIFYSFNLSAFDLNTGAMLWTSPRFATHTSYFFTYQSNNPLILHTDNDTEIAIDPVTGEILSRQKVKHPVMTVSNGDVTIENSVENSKRAFRALDQNNNLLWERPYEWAEFWPTFLENGDVIWQHGSGIYSFERIDSRTGRQVWKSEKAYVSNFALMNNTLYALGKGGALEALNLGTGERIGTILFDTPPGSSPFWVTTSGDYLLVYFGDSRELIAFKNE